MFATLLGGLPRPVDDSGSAVDDVDRAIELILESQVQAGLEPLTDGRLRGPGFLAPLAGLGGIVPGPGGPRLSATPTWTQPLTVEGWRFAATHTTGLVKQALPGPYSAARRLGPVDGEGVTENLAAADFASALRREILELGEAGCQFVEIEEPDAHLIDSDPVERGRFIEAHDRLLDGVSGIHVSLAITGGNADTAGAETLLAAPYPSFAFDLIAGPDNWRLVRAVPGDRGVICGAMSDAPGTDDGPELLLWAAAYAASSNARGRDRVGLATSGGLGELTWKQALTKMERLGKAARLAGLPADEAMKLIDPRAVDSRSGC